ncbi:probable CoA ligase CCL5 [Rhodamnia argentea]|uniref:Probable CoA ligase CCL5 n=1 Tax=Rhodamnia argentea TaxID=178133 RepID=A0A8B8QQE2_9MYRT|nr:probable CoA ligase CCL5 [Rhodamnia argentea]
MRSMIIKEGFLFASLGTVQEASDMNLLKVLEDSKDLFPTLEPAAQTYMCCPFPNRLTRTMMFTMTNLNSVGHKRQWRWLKYVASAFEQPPKEISKPLRVLAIFELGVVNMSVEEGWSIPNEETRKRGRSVHRTGCFDPRTGIYNSLFELNEHQKIPTNPDLDVASYVLSQFPHALAESRVALIDAATNCRITYAQLHRSIRSLAYGLYHALGIRKGDVVFLLAPNSLLYPTMCLAILSIGAILTPANPVNTTLEIAKQVADSGAKIAISAPEELHKLIPTKVPTMLTTKALDGDLLSVEELIECCDPIDFPQERPTQSDTAAVLYSSGTTGTSKGVILTHANFISVVTLLNWSVRASSSQDDVFLCFIPMFHIYGLAFFGLGLFCSGITTVVMQRFDFQTMLDAIKVHQVNNIPAVPPVILTLVKHASNMKCDLSSLRRVGSGAAPLSKEVTDGFREKFPWVELRQGYGLTESSGAANFFATDEEAKAHSGSCGSLIPNFSAKIVNIETGSPLPPNIEGELWLRGPTIMKGYLRNEEATTATLDPEGWLMTGDLSYFDEDGYLYIVDRIKELIKHNGYQVAPAELEALLLSHPEIVDAAVIPLEDEEAGQVPMAYVVRASGSELTENQVIRFIADQVAPYKKVRRVGFISTIPKSAAGKILRKQLISQTQQQLISSL